MSVERFMQRMADGEVHGDVPPASAVWWRAEFRRRFDAEQRALRPIRITETAAFAACVITAAVLTAGAGPWAWIAVGGAAAMTAAGAALAIRMGSR